LKYSRARLVSFASTDQFPRSIQLSPS